MPGFDGNAIEKALKGKQPEDIIDMMDPDAELTKWFKDSFNAVAEQRPVPDLGSVEVSKAAPAQDIAP